MPPKADPGRMAAHGDAGSPERSCPARGAPRRFAWGSWPDGRRVPWGSSGGADRGGGAGASRPPCGDRGRTRWRLGACGETARGGRCSGSETAGERGGGDRRRCGVPEGVHEHRDPEGLSVAPSNPRRRGAGCDRGRGPRRLSEGEPLPSVMGRRRSRAKFVLAALRLCGSGLSTSIDRPAARPRQHGDLRHRSDAGVVPRVFDAAMIGSRRVVHLDRLIHPGVMLRSVVGAQAAGIMPGPVRSRAPISQACSNASVRRRGNRRRFGGRVPVETSDGRRLRARPRPVSRPRTRRSARMRGLLPVRRRRPGSGSDARGGTPHRPSTSGAGVKGDRGPGGAAQAPGTRSGAPWRPPPASSRAAGRAADAPSLQPARPGVMHHHRRRLMERAAQAGVAGAGDGADHVHLP